MVHCTFVMYAKLLYFNCAHSTSDGKVKVVKSFKNIHTIVNDRLSARGTGHSFLAIGHLFELSLQRSKWLIHCSNVFLIQKMMALWGTMPLSLSLSLCCMVTSLHGKDTGIAFLLVQYACFFLLKVCNCQFQRAAFGLLYKFRKA